MRLHITGASGSGVTTLGAALCAQTGWRHCDTDDFYWLKTDPPFTQKRPVEERITLLREAFAAAPQGWVLSGSIMSWGEPLIPLFDRVLFVSTPTPLRIARIEARERERYGADIEPGGRLHEHSRAFINWASRYDEPDFPSRSRALHEAWLATLTCPVQRLDGSRPTALLVQEVLGR